MVEFVSRKRVFQKYPHLAKQIKDYQQAVFESTVGLYFEGEKIFLNLEDELPTILTKQAAAELNAESTSIWMSKRDEFQNTQIQIEWSEHIIAELDASSFNDFVKNIGKSIKELIIALEWEEIIVIGDIKDPYLSQDNPHKPVKQAVEKLLKMGITRTSNQGIRLNKDNCTAFFASMFWVVKCNASAPGIYFSSSSSNIVGTLCQYGNIHFVSYGKTENSLLRAALKLAKFTEAPNGICQVRYYS